MRKLWLAFAAIGAAASCATAKPEGETLPRNWDDRYLDNLGSSGARPTLAVLPFIVSENLQLKAHLRIGDMLTTELQHTGRFDMVERDRMEEVLREQEFGQSGKVDPTSAAKIGKLVGAQLVVFGVLSSGTQQKIDKFAYDLIRTEVRIDARAVSTSTGQLTFSESADGTSEAKVVTDAHGRVISGVVDTEREFVQASQRAAVALSQRIARQFPVVGVVVSVERDDIIIDLGSDRDVAPQNQILILRPIERLRHPVTGEYIGWKKKILGVAEVRAVDVASSTARVVRRTPVSEPIRAGDVAVLRPRE